MSNKVFVSYSWDSENHKIWVHNLVNDLRKEGFEANYDQALTAVSTVNLYQMMIENISKNDYVILVITENYTTKADDYSGGVGYETLMMLPLIQENLNKLIILIKQPGRTDKKVPVYLKGIHYFDFSSPSNYVDEFDKLIYRLQKVPQVFLEPVGEMKIRVPKKSSKDNMEIAERISMPKLSPPNDLEKEKFLKAAYAEIINSLKKMLDQLILSNPELIYEVEDKSSSEKLFKFYLKGNSIHRLRIWLGSFGGGSEQVNFSVGAFEAFSGNNGINGWVSAEVNSDYDLILKMPMNFKGSSNEAMTEEMIAKEIFDSYIVAYLKHR